MEKGDNPKELRKTSRMPENSTYFELIIPALLVIMAIITFVLILFAVGVLMGIVSF